MILNFAIAQQTRYVQESDEPLTSFTRFFEETDKRVIDANDFIEQTDRKLPKLSSLLTIDSVPPDRSRNIDLIGGNNLTITSNPLNNSIIFKSTFDDSNAGFHTTDSTLNTNSMANTSWLGTAKEFTAAVEHSDSLAMLDGADFFLGTGYDWLFRWSNVGDDHAVIATDLGSTLKSGNLVFVQQGDESNANRSPAFVSNPTFLVYSADETQAGDYIRFFHDQTNPVIDWGNGELDLNGNTKVTGNFDATGTITGTNVSSGTDPGHDHTSTSVPTHDNLTAGTIAAHDTTATGAELDSLTDDSMVDTKHRHSELSAPIGSPERVLSVDASGNVTVLGGGGFNLWADNRRLALGADDDAWIFYNGTNVQIIPDLVGQGGVWIDKGQFDAVDFGQTNDDDYALISTMRETADDSVFGMWAAGQYDGASTHTKGVAGINGLAYGTSDVNMNRLEGGFYEMRQTGTGTTNMGGGVRVRGQMTAAGTVKVHKGFEVLDFSNTGGGTLEENTGLWINDLTAATINQAIVIDSDTIGLTLGADQDILIRWVGSYLSIPNTTKIGDPSNGNHTQISSLGDLSFAGNAGFYPRRIRQASIPAVGSGTTQIAVSEMIFWVDSDDDSVHLVYNDSTAGIKSVALT